MYSCVATSVTGFIQQLAVSYVSNGYAFYVVGRVPAGKDPAQLDAKLVQRYGIAMTKWTRARRKRAGAASVQYLRFRDVFVLLATHGAHKFFDEEARSIRDLRRVPLKVFGYAVSQKRGHAHVRIERDEFRGLKAYFLRQAAHRRAETVTEELQALPFEPYAPVRRQLLQLVRAINRTRRAAGFDPITFEAVRLRRRIVRPFGSPVSEREMLVGGRRGEFERGGGASSSPSHQHGGLP